MNQLTVRGEGKAKKGSSINIRRDLYEALFVTVAEINYRCGLINGRGCQQAQLMQYLVKNFTSHLMRFSETDLRKQLSERKSSGALKTTVYVNSETATSLDKAATAVNCLFCSESGAVTRVDVLELLLFSFLEEVKDKILALNAPAQMGTLPYGEQIKSD